MSEREAFDTWWFDAATVEFLEKPASVHDGCLLAWNARAAIDAAIAQEQINTTAEQPAMAQEKR